MKALWTMLIAISVGLVMNVNVAEAKRLGGGGSFGSKPSHSQPMQRDNAAPDKPQSAPQGAPAQAAGAAGGAAAAARPGMGGMLGGLLAGGLLAALFFGGAFENINFADILIVALLAFIGFKLFKTFAMRRTPQAAPAGGAPGMSAPEAPIMAREQAPTSGSRSYAGAASSAGASTSSAQRRAIALPAGFDEAAFLADAKARYEQLQAAWDNGDLGTLRQYSTDKVFGEVQDMYRARHGENRTELQRVDTRLIDVTDHGDAIEASVLFDVTMIEHDASAPLLPQASTVAEVWHFVRSKRALRPEWMLDGIQQVE